MAAVGQQRLHFLASGVWSNREQPRHWTQWRGLLLGLGLAHPNQSRPKAMAAERVGAPRRPLSVE